MRKFSFFVHKPSKAFVVFFLLLGGSIVLSCSPLKTSPREEKHQLELTLQELQTNLDDLRHDLQCLQSEWQILEGKMKEQDSSIVVLKQQYLEKQQNHFELHSRQIAVLEEKLSQVEKGQFRSKEDLRDISSHANEMTTALSQCKKRLEEIEKLALGQSRKFEEVSKMQGTLAKLARVVEGSPSFFLYRVKAGDSLEKIAKAHQIPVEELKKLNQLEQDLIVVGRELKLPSSTVNGR